MIEGPRITSEGQLVIGRVYKKHVEDEVDCGDGCLLKYESYDTFVLDRHSCEQDEICRVNSCCGCIDDTFRQFGVWLTEVIVDCEITGHPMVIGEL